MRFLVFSHPTVRLIPPKLRKLIGLDPNTAYV